MRSLVRIALGGLGLAALALLAPRLYTALKYQVHIHALADAPSERVAIVFGAGLRRDGRATPILYDRVATAAELYHSGKVEKLLLSGDGLTNREPQAMRRAALDLGVPEAALILDEAGLDTYATCSRARAVFGVTQALLVTQSFHLPRALFLCEALGVQTTGVSADLRAYRQRSLAFWNLREVFATANAWWEVNVTRPAPALSEPRPIP
jgi:vancomycin permeability regulator SanA